MVDSVTYAVKAAVGVLQAIFLLLYPSFLWYTIIGISSEVVINLIISAQVDKRYPYLNQKAETLSRDEIKTIFHQVYAMFLYRACNIVGQSTDNLIISSHISVLMVGLYDNYAMIIAVLQSVLTSVLNAFTGSLGNLYATEGREKNEKVFRCLNLVNLWFIIFTSVCCLVLFQPFITLWIGEDYLFNKLVVYIIVMNYATNNMQGVTHIFKQATGLFVIGKYRPVLSVIANLVLSLIMVRSMGIGGVFLASIISRMSIAWCYDAWVIHRKGFDKSPVGFYLDCFAAILIITGLSELIQWICNLLTLSASWGGLILRGVICAVIVNLFLLIWYGRREAFGIVKAKVLRLPKE